MASVVLENANPATRASRKLPAVMRIGLVANFVQGSAWMNPCGAS